MLAVGVGRTPKPFAALRSQAECAHPGLDSLATDAPHLLAQDAMNAGTAVPLLAALVGRSDFDV